MFETHAFSFCAAAIIWERMLEQGHCCSSPIFQIDGQRLMGNGCPATPLKWWAKSLPKSREWVNLYFSGPRKHSRSCVTCHLSNYEGQDVTEQQWSAAAVFIHCLHCLIACTAALLGGFPNGAHDAANITLHRCYSWCTGCTQWRVNKIQICATVHILSEE